MPTGLALAGGAIIPPAPMFCANAPQASINTTKAYLNKPSVLRPFKLALNMEIELLDPLLTSFSLLAVPAVSFRLCLTWQPQPAPDSPVRTEQFQSAELSADLSARSIASLARSECGQSRHFYLPSRNYSVVPLRNNGSHLVQCARYLRGVALGNDRLHSPGHHEGSPFQSAPKDSVSAGAFCHKHLKSEKFPRSRNKSTLPKSPATQ